MGRVMSICIVIILLMGASCKTAELRDTRNICYLVALLLSLVKIKLYGIGW